MGTGCEVTKLYGMGTDIDQLFTAGIELSYNLPNWMFGIEYSSISAWYGKINHNNGRVNNATGVSNQRIVGVASFSF